MPLRILPQIVDILYSSYIKRNELYKQKLYKIPAIKCFVLYNGTREWNPGKLKLSDAFKIHSEEITLELFVNVININYEKSHELLEQSEALRGYSYLVSLIRKYQEELTRDEAIVKAVNKCMEEGILKEYLEKNLKEVMNMLVYEYDEKELYGEARYEEGLEEGREEGAEKVLYFINQGYTPEKAVEMAKKR